jgi:tetratricopeptide (TPR) repeat protein
MDPGKLIEIQQQMRLNQAEMKDSFNDLDSWINEIKEKDENLKKQDDKLPQELPPVRNSLQKKKKKKKPKKKPENNNSESNSTRISGYDFAAWDRFDVSKACDDIEKNKDESSESEYETDDEWEELRMKQQAAMLKEQGNQYFKEGKLDEAIDLYTRGIQCDPNNGLLPANRAMALLKQGKYAAAELDCAAAIMLDPTYFKSYHRRGTARVALKKYSEAKSDFQKVLSFDSNNKQAKSELEKLEKLMNPPKFSVSTDGESGLVKPVYKPPDQRSQKPLKRLLIEEVGDDEERALDPKEPLSDTKQKLLTKDHQDFEKFVHSKDSTDSDSCQDTTLVNGDAVNIKSPADICGIQISEIAEDAPECDLKLDLSSVHDDKMTRPTDPGAKKQTRLQLTSPQTSPRVPPAPSTSYQFQADWKVLRNSREQFYQYLRQINPASYSKLFGEFLDADVLMKIMHTLRDFYVPENIDFITVLEELPLVKRFGMTVMFLSSNDNKVIIDLVNHIQDKCESNKLKKIKQNFQL